MGLQYYSLLQWKWTWGHKSRVMTSSQSLGGGENVLALPPWLFKLWTSYIENVQPPRSLHTTSAWFTRPFLTPSLAKTTSWLKSSSAFSCSFIHRQQRSADKICRTYTRPHRSQWFSTPKGVFSIGIICSNYTLNQRGSWRGHQAQSQGSRALSRVQALTCCVAFNKPSSTAGWLSYSGYTVKGIFHCHTNTNKSRKRYRNLWKNTEAVHAGFMVWFPWQPSMLNIS